MSILQLDSVNVLCRSHFLPVFARLGAYDRSALDDWLWRSGENVESTAHEASITAMEHHPLAHHSRLAARLRFSDTFLAAHPDYAAEVLRQVRERGASAVSDLEAPGGRSGPWWGWSKGKTALEALLIAGELAVAERTATFLTRYDLPERVLHPAVQGAGGIEPAEATRRMLSLAARSHGIGTDRDLADYFRIKVTVARPILAELVAEGRLARVEVEGWKESAYLHPEALRPRRVSARALLSPFDPVVWFRPRGERLFDFHYKIEIYVPQAQRKFGYYVLPFLLDDAIVARVDLKADRKRKRLLVRGAFLEAGRDPKRVVPALRRTLEEMATWLDLDGVEVGTRGDLASPLRAGARARRSSTLAG